MAPDERVVVRSALEEAGDEGVDVRVEGLSRDGDEVGEAADGVRADFRVRVFGEHEEFGDEEVQRELAVDFDVEFPGVVFTSFLKRVEGGLWT